MVLDFFKMVFFHYFLLPLDERNIRQLSSLKMFNSEKSGDTNISIGAHLQHRTLLRRRGYFSPSLPLYQLIFLVSFSCKGRFNGSLLFSKSGTQELWTSM